MIRSELFKKALNMTQEKYINNPDFFILESIILQLEYLLAVETGNESDLTKLSTIFIGRIVSRDIDNWDATLAEILYLAAEQARIMCLENGV